MAAHYTPELAETILRRLAAGESLREICQSPSMPNRSTVNDWMDRIEGFQDAYDKAKERSGDAWGDAALAAALEDGDPQDRRMRWDALRFHASKLAPKRWGDKTQVAVSGTVSLESLIAATVNKPDPGWTLPPRPKPTLSVVDEAADEPEPEPDLAG